MLQRMRLAKAQRLDFEWVELQRQFLFYHGDVFPFQKVAFCDPVVVQSLDGHGFMIAISFDKADDDVVALFGALAGGQ